MKSIRTYLLLALLAIITIVTFLSALHGYQSGIDKVDELFDQRLRELAEIIVDANHDTSKRDNRATAIKPSVFYQIFSKQNVLLVRSENAPDWLLFEPTQKAGFKDVNYSGYRWRTYQLIDERLKRWVLTAERIDLRYGLADTIVSTVILPTVLAVPIVASIIWLAIGIGLRPLKELVSQLNNKRADDLTPIFIRDTPDELTQLITTINSLFNRLNEGFIREQQFSADAAHELRTPISALKVQMHNVKQSQPKNGVDLQPLSEGIERMGHVVEQILSLYRNTSDQAAQKQVRNDFYALAQDCIANEYSQLDLKKQQISLQGDSPCWLMGDRFALETLLQNLITNAIKYSPNNGTIQVSLHQEELDVKLIVEDSGLGIAEKDYERVFERFYRVSGDQHASGVLGCGLGLAIVKHIVVMYNANIKLSSSDTLGGLKVVVCFPQLRLNA